MPLLTGLSFLPRNKVRDKLQQEYSSNPYRHWIPFPDQVEDKFHGNDTEKSFFKELMYYEI
jgi:hypothetical protein